MSNYYAQLAHAAWDAAPPSPDFEEEERLERLLDARRGRRADDDGQAEEGAE